MPLHYLSLKLVVRNSSRDSLESRRLSRNISNVGLIGTAAAVGGIWMSGIKTHDGHARETGILSWEAFANSATVICCYSAP
jgi:hypothetical protein